MTQILLISLVIAAIIVQVPHAYWTFIKASKLKNINARRLQAGAFCAIVSVAIFTFVWIGETELALFGALIEVVINLFYYTSEFWDVGFGQKRKRWKYILSYWRQRWIYFFIALLLPAFIFVFSEFLKDYI